MAGADVIIVDGAGGVRVIEVDDFIEQVGGAIEVGPQTSSARLLEWAMGEAYELTNLTLDSDGVVSSATAKWPDGSAGVFSTTLKNSNFLTVDAYTITHVGTGKTVTQSAVTRDSNGNVTIKPALTIA